MFFASTILLLTIQLILAEVPTINTDSFEGQISSTHSYDDSKHNNTQSTLNLQQGNGDSLSRMIEMLNKSLNPHTMTMHEELNELKSAMNDGFINLSKVINTTKIGFSLPKDCDEALQANGQNGIYKIKIPVSELEPFYVYCVRNVILEDSNTAPWTIIQLRKDGSINFNRNWTEYQRGFGKFDGEFFIGLDKLHALTNSILHELWIQMEDFEGTNRWARYSSFAIGDSSESYVLKTLGNYTGDAGGVKYPGYSLLEHVGHKWSTYDKNNEKIEGTPSCTNNRSGAWWHRDCSYSDLNGKYLKGKTDTDNGIYWNDWRGLYYSLKYVRMAMRPIQ